MYTLVLYTSKERKVKKKRSGEFLQDTNKRNWVLVQQSKHKLILD